jgi:dTDP-4-amino-4,6-dideoxygalactose transaminase
MHLDERSTLTEPRRIPIVDLKAQLERIRAEIEEAVARVLESTAFVFGEDVKQLEREFAAFCGTTEACAVANGTDALQIALRAHGIGPGDEVVTVANTFIGTGEAILLVGARPVFVDVDAETHTMDPSRLEAALTTRTRLIVPVHLYGHPADMTAIGEIAHRHGVPVLEDAAQAHGAEWRGRRAGALGHAACFSFYPAKNLGAYGDAGMVTSSDEAFIARVRRIANHGAGAHQYDNVVLGTNSRLDTLQAAILRVKLRHLERWTEERRSRAAAYSRALEGVAGITLPREHEGARSAWHLYTIRSPEREALQAHLRERGIASAVHYPRPIHLQPSMAAAGGRPGDLPVSERLCREVLCLPIYPELPDEDVARIAREVRSFAGSARPVTRAGPPDAETPR